ncbi:hypothetical protein [Ferruginibacter sp.]|uniref:hypothetical protein n=1 Tax=Ferruginibacter sp. TaxID=1940288 RepID=UPI0019ADEAA8|nr:hypothetical protein [Ferruginibacter sp.]MBC7626826.1 hypothetical protein [Ferruginibacter sp.]
MKILYGIAGFTIGVLAGLLFGVLETKLLIHLHQQTVIPFVVGATVLVCILTGVITGIKTGKR